LVFYYEMTRNRFQIHLSILLIAVCVGWGIGATPTTALAQEPTPTSASSSQPEMYITVTNSPEGVNVRAGPSAALYPPIGHLNPGEVYPATGRSPGGDWIQIEYPNGPNGKGWVYSPYVAVSPGTLPIVEPPPTPVPPATSTIDPTLAAQFTIEATATRKPTFTPAPARTVPAFTDLPPKRIETSIPLAGIIFAIGALGLIGFIASVLPRR
jgi:uncharacterized protein YraI